MASWDDEEYDAELASSALKNSWDDEIEEDAFADSWENALDEAKPAQPTHKRVSLKQKIQEKEHKERLDLDAKAMAAVEEDDASKRERLKKVEQDNDMAHLTDLMGNADIHPRAAATKKLLQQKEAQPAKLSDFKVFHPTGKPEFETLRKTLVPILTDLSNVSSLQYSNLVTDLSRDLCKKLSMDQVRKVIATLNAVVSEKQREERANRGKKQKAQLKGVAGKKNESLDTKNYDEVSDLDDDDFM